MQMSDHDKNCAPIVSIVHRFTDSRRIWMNNTLYLVVAWVTKGLHDAIVRFQFQFHLGIINIEKSIVERGSQKIDSIVLLFVGVVHLKPIAIEIKIKINVSNKISSSPTFDRHANCLIQPYFSSYMANMNMPKIVIILRARSCEERGVSSNSPNMNNSRTYVNIIIFINLDKLSKQNTVYLRYLWNVLSLRAHRALILKVLPSLADLNIN